MSEGRNIYKTKMYGRLKVLGFVGKWSDTPNGEKEDHYLCRCSCGRKVRFKGRELESGAVFSCDRCVMYGPDMRRVYPDKEQKRGDYEDSKSTPNPIGKELTMRLLCYRKLVPSWWWRCLGTVVDQICQMDGRGTYTDKQICEYFECPQAVLDNVRKFHSARIKRIRRDWQKITEQFDYIEKIPSDLLPEGVFNHFYHVAITSTSKRYKGDNRDV